MTSIHVCPLSKVDVVLADSGARSVVSLLAQAHRLPDLASIARARRLHLALSDIVVATEGHALPEASHVGELLAFIGAWDRRDALLIHCYAGVSRSTAAAYISLCALDPATDERVHALRLRAASPTATPNRRLVAMADSVLGRAGRMIAAIEEIGRGADCFEGVSFALPVPVPSR